MCVYACVHAYVCVRGRQWIGDLSYIGLLVTDNIIHYHAGYL